jgi:two-component system chemotaxis response regulator CheB
MQPKRIILIGASAGGFSAVRRIFSELNPAISAAIFTVLHTTPGSMSLAATLAPASKLPVKVAADQPIEQGVIYIAPPDIQLMLERDRMRLVRGPKESLHRPSIDVLFRSAAFAYRSRVIGVVLTGMLDDGTAGLFQIKRSGGVTVVQDPKEAEFSSMPLNACTNLQVDYIVSLEKIAPLLSRLAPQQLISTVEDVQTAHPHLFGETVSTTETEKVRLTGYICPECGGPVREIQDGNLVRFRCRVGHGYGLASLAYSHADKTESLMWSALQSLKGRQDIEDRLKQ